MYLNHSPVATRIEQSGAFPSPPWSLNCPWSCSIQLTALFLVFVLVHVSGMNPTPASSEQHLSGSKKSTMEIGDVPATPANKRAIAAQNKNTAPCAPCQAQRKGCKGGSPCTSCIERIGKGIPVKCVPGKPKGASLRLVKGPFRYETGQREMPPRRSHTSPKMYTPTSTQQDDSPMPSSHARTGMEMGRFREFHELQEDASPSLMPEGSSSFVLPISTSPAGYTSFLGGPLVEEPRHDSPVFLDNSVFNQTTTPFVHDGLSSSHILGHYISELIQQVPRDGDMDLGNITTPIPTSQPYMPTASNNSEVQPLAPGAFVDEPTSAENYPHKWNEAAEFVYMATKYNLNVLPHVHPNEAGFNSPTDMTHQSERRGEASRASYHHTNGAQWSMTSVPQFELQRTWINPHPGIVVEADDNLSLPHSETQAPAEPGYAGYSPEALWDLYRQYAANLGLQEVEQSPSLSTMCSSAHYQAGDFGAQSVQESNYSTVSGSSLAGAIPRDESSYEHFVS